MRPDEENLYTPNADDATTARTLDARTINDNETNQSSSRPETPIQPPLNEYNKGRWFILEIPVFLVFFGRYLSEAVYQNQILYQTCITAFHYNASQCIPLLGVNHETEEARRIEAQVQPYVAHILMARSLLESIIPALVSLFIGPWSDKFGRRPIILTTFTGYFTGYVILSTLAFISTRVTLSPWVFLLSSVPSVLSGGSCALITGIYCYISDVAKERSRAMKMVFNEAALLAGMTVGNMTSGYIYGATNTVTVFSISAIFLLLALLYAIFFAKESLPELQLHQGSKLREFFRFDLVKDLVRTCFERRPSFDRAIIWLTMVALTVAIFTMEGDANVTYLFVRQKFEWTLKDYTTFNAMRIIVQIMGNIFGMILLRRLLKFSIVSMTMIAFASCVLESTVRATAVQWWEMYFGMSLGLMRGIMGPMSRAILSHIAPPTEVGKIFALTTSLENLSPLGAAPLYTTVYDATLLSYPGAFNFISATLYTFCFTLIAIIYGIQKSLGNAVAYQAIGS